MFKQTSENSTIENIKGFFEKNNYNDEIDRNDIGTGYYYRKKLIDEYYMKKKKCQFFAAHFYHLHEISFNQHNYAYTRLHVQEAEMYATYV